MTRHMRIREDPMFMLQARIRTVAHLITDDVNYILEREAFDSLDEDWVRLNDHGIEVLTHRVLNNVKRLQEDARTLNRHLKKRVQHD